MVKVLNLQLLVHSGNNIGQAVHTRASVTKKYNLVPVEWGDALSAGKVIVGLALHWTCVTDFSGLSTYRVMA